jgi:anaerobic ribonucleoside-triphosphate reductase activating protein
MLKYTDYKVVFREIPDMVTLAINISNCPNNCSGCHSPYLRKDIGTELTEEELDRLIKENDGINCVCFMGEGRGIERLTHLIERVKKYHGIDTALYTGSDDFDETIFGDN